MLSVLAVVPFVRYFCFRFNLFDQPGPLKIHTRLVPRLGGIAIAIALVVGPVAARGKVSEPALFVFGAMALVWVVGLIDDIRGLRPAIRLAAQIAAAILLWAGGWRIAISGSEVLNVIATCVFVALFINAFNFLDGADGLASGVTALIAIGYIGLPASTLGGLGATVAWCLLGACVGFLAFNYPPAKIFLGDSGSTLLGFAIAFLSLNLSRDRGDAPSALLFPVLVAAIPLLDLALAVLRRARQGRSPFSGDRRHFYDLLLTRGWTARKVAVTCYALTAGLVVAGWATMRMDFSRALVTSVLIGVGLLAAGVRLGSLRSHDTDLKRGAKGNPRSHWGWQAVRRTRQKI